MEVSGHCSFCDHKEYDFTTGNLCGLTGKKADFIRKCPRMYIDLNAKEEIARINFEYKSIQDKKLNVSKHLILYTIIGVTIIFAGIYFANEGFGSGQISRLASKQLYWFSAESLISIGIGMSFIGYAFVPYIKYTNANNAIKSQKKRLDNLVALYDYDYKIDFEEEDEYVNTKVKLYRSKRPVK